MRKISVEDYLRTIYRTYEEQEDKKEGVRSIDVAESLGITKPSVSAMVRKLSKRDFLKIKPYSNIFFTERGMKEAKRITHNYRVIEVFLTKVLGYDKRRIDDDAHKLEHAFSQEAIRRLDKFLNNPKRCPHGKIIHKR